MWQDTIEKELQDWSLKNLLVWYPVKNEIFRMSLFKNFHKGLGLVVQAVLNNTDLQLLARMWNSNQNAGLHARNSEKSVLGGWFLFPSFLPSISRESCAYLRQLKLGGRHISKLHLGWTLVRKYSISLGVGVAAFSCHAIPCTGTNSVG